MNQEDFEQLLQDKDPFIVWFSAKWCVPCKKMDKEAIMMAAKQVDIPYYFCDNDYTPGYCNIRRFPTIVYFENRKMRYSIVSSDTKTVCDWILGLKQKMNDELQ